MNPIEPLKVPSLKDACVARLEGLILSGELQIGERLPSERDFAARLGLSRPVLHEALVDLNAKGLVQIIPRRGVFVSDFRRHGSLALLSSLLSYHNGHIDPAFTHSLIEMRLIIETEAARLAALQRRQQHLEEFQALLESEAHADCGSAPALTELDFDFHLLVAIASGNLIYPLLINSFKGVYTSLTGQFFRQHCNTPLIDTVFHFHEQIVQAIQVQDAVAAVQHMTEMLKHGEDHLLL